MDHRLGFRLHAFGQAVEDVGGLVHPASLRAHLGEDVGLGGPKSQRPVSDEKFEPLQSPFLQITQYPCPGLLAFPIPGLDRQKFLVSLDIHANDNQSAEIRVFIGADMKVNAVDPTVDELLACQTALAPNLILGMPLLL